MNSKIPSQQNQSLENDDELLFQEMKEIINVEAKSEGGRSRRGFFKALALGGLTAGATAGMITTFSSSARAACAEALTCTASIQCDENSCSENKCKNNQCDSELKCTTNECTSTLKCNPNNCKDNKCTGTVNCNGKNNCSSSNTCASGN